MEQTIQKAHIRHRSTEAEREHEQAARNFMRLAEYHVRKFQRETESPNLVHLPPRLRAVQAKA